MLFRSDEAEQPKKSIFKQLFTFPKEDNDMKQEELVAAMSQALGEPLTKFTQALEANTVATQALLSQQGEEEESPKADDELSNNDDKTKVIEEELSSVKTELSQLTAAFNKAASTPAIDTTDSEEENLGEEGKYSSLL